MTYALPGHRGSATAFATKGTLLGAGILIGGLGAMSAVYEVALDHGSRKHGLLSGGLFGLAGYAIDRWLLPQNLLREFRRRMGGLGTFAKYTALALAAGS